MASQPRRDSLKTVDYPTSPSDRDSFWSLDTSSDPKPVRLKLSQPKAVKSVEVEDTANVDDQIRDLIAKGLLQPVATEVLGEEPGEIDAHKQTLRRKVRYTVEVPVTRKVKVPTVTTKEVEVEELVRVQTTEQKQVTITKDVEEEYTDIEECTAYRLKEVWVKKLVPEAYTKRVEVRKKRIVQVPTMVTQEVPVEKEVPVKRKMIREVPGFRIDEIKDTKVVEVEGYQVLEVVPQLKDPGRLTIDSTRDLTGPRGQIIERKVGQVWDIEDERLDDIDTDSDGDPETHKVHHWTEGLVGLDGTETRLRPKAAVSSSRKVREQLKMLKPT